MTPTISQLRARQILDSRGRPTVEVELALSDGTAVLASVPSGASTGRHEAVELRDGDPARFGGRGVLRAVRAIDESIAPALRGVVPDLAAVDARLNELDGTADKSRLGANATLAVSLATARAAAATAGVPLWRHLADGEPPLLPLPMVNILSGGLHAGRQLDFQDFLVIPVGAGTFSDALEMCVAVHTAIGAGARTPRPVDAQGRRGRLRSPAELARRGAGVAGTRGRRAPAFEPGADVAYALDVAATHFFEPADGTYHLRSEARVCSAGEIG